MAYKVNRVSKNGKMLELIDDKGAKDWYFLAQPVIAYVQNNIKVNDEVDVKTEESGDETTITFITKKGGVVQTGGGASSSGGGYNKSSVEVQESIVRQSMMKAAADAVSRALQGQVNVDTLSDSIIAVYNKLYAYITK